MRAKVCRVRVTRYFLFFPALFFTSSLLAQVAEQPAASPAVIIDIAADTTMAVEDPPEVDPCAMTKDAEFLGLDWSRRKLHHGLCASVRWFDGFFGEQRFDEAARKIRGRVSYAIERRERVGTDGKARLHLRVSTPNIADRLSLFVESDDDRVALVERTDGGSEALIAQPTPTGRSDSVRVGFRFDGIKNEHESLDFRTSLRLRDGKLAPSSRIRYRREFLRTDYSQWRFTEELFWRTKEGWGETTLLDYEFKISDPALARWFNEGTWSQSTLGLSWRTGIGLYRNMGNGKAGLFEIAMSGQSDAPVDIGNYGARIAYRQTLGRKWLLGEVYYGYDWPKSVPEEMRHSQSYGGLSIEVLFGHH